MGGVSIHTRAGELGFLVCDLASAARLAGLTQQPARLHMYSRWDVAHLAFWLETFHRSCSVKVRWQETGEETQVSPQHNFISSAAHKDYAD